MDNKVFVRMLDDGVPLYRDFSSGIAWAEDHRTGLGISVHPNIDESGCVEGMIARGWWDRADRIVRSHGWIYNIDHLAYDKNDPVERAVADECLCLACQKRRAILAKKFYSFETRLCGLRDDLRKFLREQGIYYELSECFDAWHFEVKCSDDEARLIDKWLDTNVVERKEIG